MTWVFSLSHWGASSFPAVMTHGNSNRVYENSCASSFVSSLIEFFCCWANQKGKKDFNKDVKSFFCYVNQTWTYKFKIEAKP